MQVTRLPNDALWRIDFTVNEIRKGLPFGSEQAFETLPRPSKGKQTLTFLAKNWFLWLADRKSLFAKDLLLDYCAPQWAAEAIDIRRSAYATRHFNRALKLNRPLPARSL